MDLALSRIASLSRASASRVRLRRSDFSTQSALLKPALLISAFISLTDSTSTSVDGAARARLAGAPSPDDERTPRDATLYRRVGKMILTQ